MIRNVRTIGLCCALLALAACGKVGDLEPRAGQAMPPLAHGQNEKQNAEKLMTPSSQARPARSDELVSKSLAREEDPFDFAPGQPIPPFPGNEEEEKQAKQDKAEAAKNAPDNDKTETPR